MGFLKNKKGAIISDYFKLNKQHEHLKSDAMYEIALYDNYLTIQIPLSKGETILKYNQIKDVEYGTANEIVQKSKSVVGRALTGGILFGGVGAIIGAASGIGKTEKKEYHAYFIISYISAKNENKFMVFEDVRLYKGAKLAEKLKELCNIDTKSS